MTGSHLRVPGGTKIYRFKRKTDERVDDGESSVCGIDRPNGGRTKRLEWTAIQVRVVRVVAPNGDGGSPENSAQQREVGGRVGTYPCWMYARMYVGCSVHLLQNT